MDDSTEDQTVTSPTKNIDEKETSLSIHPLSVFELVAVASASPNEGVI